MSHDALNTMSNTMSVWLIDNSLDPVEPSHVIDNLSVDINRFTPAMISHWQPHTIGNVHRNRGCTAIHAVSSHERNFSLFSQTKPVTEVKTPSA